MTWYGEGVMSPSSQRLPHVPMQVPDHSFIADWSVHIQQPLVLGLDADATDITIMVGHSKRGEIYQHEPYHTQVSVVFLCILISLTAQIPRYLQSTSEQLDSLSKFGHCQSSKHWPRQSTIEIQDNNNKGPRQQHPYH